MASILVPAPNPLEEGPPADVASGAPHKGSVRLPSKVKGERDLTQTWSPSASGKEGVYVFVAEGLPIGVPFDKNWKMVPLPAVKVGIFPTQGNVAVKVGTAGKVETMMVIADEGVQPPASVTVTVYVPATRPVRS